MARPQDRDRERERRGGSGRSGRSAGGSSRSGGSRGDSRGGGSSRGNGSQRHRRDRMQAAGFDENRLEDEGPNYREMSAQQLERAREDEVNNQEEALDVIYQGVRGLKNHANAINGEVVDQNKMLDELANDMDSANNDLEKQTAKVQNINNKKNKACKLYLLIAILVVLLIAVISL